MADAKLNIIIQAKDGASKVLSGVGSSLQGIGTVALGVLGTGIGALGAGLVATGAAAYGLSNDITDAMGNIQAQMGTTAETSENLANVAAAVWGNNFAGSVTEAADAVVLIKKNMEELSSDALQPVTEQAFAIQDAFEIGIGESANTAGVLMNKFGLTGQQAMDFITTGLQDGLNKSDDFIDSIAEYSGIFADAGFSAEQMYSIMATGAEGGVLGTDKISDAVKEMTIRLNEGGDDVSDAFSQIGLSFDDIAASVSAGDENWGDYFSNIISGLSDIEDPLKRNQAQVAIFGTMAEDLGVNFTDSLSDAFITLEDMAGAGDSLNAQYNTLGDAIEGFKRQGLLAIRPLGDALLGLANFAMPYVQDAMARILPIVELVAGAFGNFVTRIQNGQSPFSSLIGLINQLASAFGLPSEQVAQLGQWLNLIANTYIPNFITGVQNFFGPIMDMVTNFVSWKDILIAIGAGIAAVVIPAIVSMVVAMAPVILTVGAIVAAIALLRNMWEQNWGDIQGKTAVAVAALQQVWQNVLLPAIQSVWQWLSTVLVPFIQTVLVPWLQDNLTAGLETLRAFWQEVLLPGMQAVWEWMQGTLIPFITDTLAPWLETNIPVALEALSGYWQEVLLPAIQAVWQFMQDSLLPLLEALGEFFDAVLSVSLTALAGIWQNVLLPALETVWDFISANILPIFDSFGTKIDGVKNSVGGLSGVISNVINTLHTLASTLRDIDLPDWMTPGSPTPWENGLRGVGDAMNQLNQVSIPRLGGSLNRLSAPAVAGGGAGGGQPITIQIDARGAQRGVSEEVRRAVDQALAAAGIRADTRARTR